MATSTRCKFAADAVTPVRCSPGEGEGGRVEVSRLRFGFGSLSKFSIKKMSVLRERLYPNYLRTTLLAVASHMKVPN